MSHWGDFLRDILDTRGMSIRALSKVIDYADTALAGAIAGRCKPGRKDKFMPPLDRQDAIADALGLDADQRARLVFLANIEHAPAAMVEWLAGQEAAREMIVGTNAAKRWAEGRAAGKRWLNGPTAVRKWIETELNK